MARQVLTGVEWVVAATIPNIVAPHPNFSTETVTPVALLALLADGREADFNRYRGSNGAPGEVDESELAAVDAVHRSLLVESQVQGIRQLSEMRRIEQFTLGLHAVVALFEAVGQSELDRLDLALEALDDVLTRFEHNSGVVSDGSRALVEAAVRQQRVLRYIESRQLEAARDEAQQVETLLDRSTAFDESFPTSRGTDSTPGEAQADLATTLLDHARSARSTIEGPESRLWVSVVRSPLSRADARGIRKVAEGGNAFLWERFETVVSWTAGRQRIAFQDSVDGPLATALLHAELTGDVSGVKRHRETLGRSRAIRSHRDTSWSTGDSLRLLRQADARQPLEDVVRWVRSRGPISSLTNAARAVLDRPSLLNSVTRCDLAVLVGAAEVLERRRLGQSLDAVLAYRRRPEGRLSGESAASWAVEDVAWRACARIVPGSGRDSEIASVLLAAVDTDVDVPDYLEGSVVAVVRAITWNDVTASLRNGWRAWVIERANSLSFYVGAAVLDAIDGVGRHTVGRPRPVGLELGARILREAAHGADPPAEEVAAATTACVAGLSEVQESAARGGYGFGGLSAGQIAVGLITSFERADLWNPVAEFLRNPVLVTGQKAPVLDRLAADRPVMPDHVYSLLEGTPLATLGGKAIEMWDERPLPVSPSALRFSAAYGIVERARAIGAITQLGGSRNPEARAEAARSIDAALASGGGELEWAAVLLMQLSHDDDAVVRGESARKLAQLRSALPALRDAVDERITELMESDGILIPLLTLRGLESSDDISDSLLNRVGLLSIEHPARSVRKVASELSQ